MIDPTDATTVPVPVRREALTAAMAALEAYLAEHAITLDVFAQLELLDLALNDLEAEYDAAAAEPPPPNLSPTLSRKD